MLHSLILFGWYALSSWATHFYDRYLSPLMVIAVPVYGLLFFQWFFRRTALCLTILGTLTLAFVAVIVALHARSVFVGSTWYDHQLPLVRKYVPEFDLVAAGQSGTLGYFRDHVVNLDGKVNYEALSFQQNMWAYLEQEGIHWVCDWESYTSRYLGTRPADHGWRLVEEYEGFRLYHRPQKLQP